MLKLSDINESIRQAEEAFRLSKLILPPKPYWLVTDFRFGDFTKLGLTAVLLISEKEYKEKHIFLLRSQKVPAHMHCSKKEDIFVRAGKLAVRVWTGTPISASGEVFTIPINSELTEVVSGEEITLSAGDRITVMPGIYHEYLSLYGSCILSELSSGYSEKHDNYFADPRLGFYPLIEENTESLNKLFSGEDRF